MWNADAFYCSEHEQKGQYDVPSGYVTCARIEVGGRYDAMFLQWETVDAPQL